MGYYTATGKSVGIDMEVVHDILSGGKKPSQVAKDCLLRPALCKTNYIAFMEKVEEYTSKHLHLYL